MKAYWTLDTEWQALQNTAGANDRADLTAARSALAQYLTDACKLSARSGETADMPLETTHVLLEIGSGLVPEDSGPGWPLIKSYLPEMRGRIEKDQGVTVPGVQVRVNQGLDANGYSFAVDEIVAGSGRVAPDCQYCTSPPDVLKGFGIPEDALIPCPHPLTGTPGCWVKEVGWDRAKAWQQELWDDPMKFVVYHLEAVLRQKLADFVGLEQVEGMLRRWSKTDGGATLIKTTLPDGRARLRFARALRSMATERTPITDWKEMLESLAGVDLAVEETDAIVRLMRLRIKQRLPGNQHGAVRAELPASVDEWLMSNLQRQGRKRFLALLSQDMTAFLKVVQQGLGSKVDRAVLITRNAELRASLRRLVALDFPGLAVMSLEELNLEPPETAEPGPEPEQARVQ
jgi:flagellar biosynthesis component FlhA